MKKIILVITAILLLSGYALLNQKKIVDVINNNNTNTETPADNKPSPAIEKPIANKLDLSNKNLKKIPDNVFSQTNLEELNVSNNQLTGSIQAEIRHLQNLRILDASNNLMTGVPAEVGQLQNLEILNLSNNQLTGLPYELGNLKNLKTLNISGNNYSALDLDIIQKKLPADVNIIK